MKKVIIIGANGQTSKEIISRLVKQQDVSLTLFLRNSQRLEYLKNSNSIIFEGDATNLASLKKAIKGQDIVISTMGGLDIDIKNQNIVKAMEDVNVNRLVVISNGGIYDELPEPFNTWDKKMVGNYRLPNLKAVNAVEKSSLCYTILRPVWLTNKSIETFELTQKGEIYKGTETSRASLAHFIANLVEDPTLYKYENLGISQPNTDGEKPAAYR